MQETLSNLPTRCSLIFTACIALSLFGCDSDRSSFESGTSCEDGGCQNLCGDACGDANLDEDAPDGRVDESDANDDAGNDAETGGGTGDACEDDDDCDDRVCDDDVCAAPSCDDETRNGDETDVDCGGECGECERGAACEHDEDCATGHCAGTCVIGPTAGFELSTLYADTDQDVRATSTAIAGDGEIALVEYDWGDGFTEDAEHAFAEESESTEVVQRVTDEHGLTATATLEVNVYRPVRMSETDKTELVRISGEGLVVGQLHTLGVSGGVRSDASVAPGSGVFYFEATRLGPTGYYSYGVTVAGADLTMSAGGTTTSISSGALGHIVFNGNAINGPMTPHVGFVIDYRGAMPIVHVISADGEDAPLVRRTETLQTTAPVFAAYQGIPANHGPCVSFNFGADTTNHPFLLDPVAVLTTAGQAELAGELTLGFGRTRARPRSEAPELETDGDLSVAAGTELTFTATAIDEEEGDLTAFIEWENLATSIHERETGVGGTFTFTPPEVGRYPIRVFVRDSARVLSEQTLMVVATGTLPQHDPVRLAPHEQSGEGIVLSPDGLSARFTIDKKGAIRANQPNYGRFWYFEAQSLTEPAAACGGGAVIERGSLDPMVFETMQPSTQINFGGGVYDALVHYAGVDATSRYFGWAIDYRGEHPIVYVIVQNAVAATLVLDDVWVPIYPMLYGNGTSELVGYDARVNFGATAFHNNPVTALTNAGISTVGFEAGWGDANVP
jgi:hypothetical protein